MRTGTLFSADCFGAVLSTPAQDAGPIASADLREWQLPPAMGIVRSFLHAIGPAPGAVPYVGPDQKALENLLAQLSGSLGTKAQT
jgi:hypothetical protein